MTTLSIGFQNFIQSGTLPLELSRSQNYFPLKLVAPFSCQCQPQHCTASSSGQFHRLLVWPAKVEQGHCTACANVAFCALLHKKPNIFITPLNYRENNWVGWLNSQVKVDLAWVLSIISLPFSAFLIALIISGTRCTFAQHHQLYDEIFVLKKGKGFHTLHIFSCFLF